MTVGLVTATAAGRRTAGRLARAWPGAHAYEVRELPAAWAECDRLVCFLAVGATVRLVAPLLRDKHEDPGVVCVDEAARFAVAVLGGHAGGANALARDVAAVLGATPVVTTATDAAGVTALDGIGWPVEGDVAAVTRAMLDGADVTLTADTTWPLPPLPVHHGQAPQPAPVGAAPPKPRSPGILVTDRVVEVGPGSVVLRPPSLVVGVGASRGADPADARALVASALAEAGLSPSSVAEVATVEAKADEAAVLAVADMLAARLRTYPSERLAAVPVPNPSDVVRDAVGTPSVAEAAALAGGGDLLVAKRRSATATVAVARREPRGRLAVVGLGPGARDLLPPRAVQELQRAAHVVGLDQYVDRVRDLLRPGTRVYTSGLGAEEERARTAVQLAVAGHAVALVGSGDAGVYAMAAPALEVADERIDVVMVPGITAMHAAAALVGAPLGHDHCAISLSDLHTPWAAIEARVRAAAQADLVVAFYNPRSRGRDWQLPAALRILAGSRPPDTPVAVVTDASRPGERVTLATLAQVDAGPVGMTSLVIVGNSSSRIVAGRFVTPRGYAWSPGADEQYAGAR